MQLDDAVVVAMRDDVDLVADPRLDVQFFAQLPCEAGGQRFARIALAAREFPQAFEVNAALAPSHQIAAVSDDDRRGDEQRHITVQSRIERRGNSCSSDTPGTWDFSPRRPSHPDPSVPG